MKTSAFATLALLVATLAGCDDGGVSVPPPDAAEGIAARPDADPALPLCRALGCDEALCNRAGVCTCHDAECVQ